MAKYWAKRIRNVIFTGLPGSGKTALGKAYAYHSGRYFLDLDQFIAKYEKKSIATIFEEQGEEGFRKLEERALKKISRKHNYVFALGGGTFCSEERCNMLKDLGMVVYLHTSPEVLTQRILAERVLNYKPKRPLLAEFSDKEKLQEKVSALEKERSQFYEQAHVTLETQYSSIENLSLQLGYYERRLGYGSYMKEVKALED